MTSAIPNIINKPAPATPYFTPAQEPPAGSAVDPQPDGKPIPTLFKPLKIRGVEFHNRIFLSPLCQYSAENGVVAPWHMAHLGGIFTRGPGLTIMEATAVLPQGRITPEDCGLWNEVQEGPLREIVQFARSQNQKIGIQLAHAGRKASAVAPWLDMSSTATEAAGGWPDDVWAPSAIPHHDRLPTPKELTKEGIKGIVTAFVAAAKRAVRVGFDVIEIHNAHGYLLNSFLSPVCNKRTDEYGGSFENRTRLTLEVVDGIRAAIPTDMPLFLRISATDWLESTNEPSWTLPDTVRLSSLLFAHGVDFLDVSSGGNSTAQEIVAKGLYQAPLAEAVRKAAIEEKGGEGEAGRLLVGSVGSITTGKLAQEVLEKGQADAVLVGRTFQKNPGAVWAFAEDLDVQIRVARQIEWGFTGRASGKSKA